MARWLAPRLGSPVRGSVPGRLYAIPHARGWFPALVPGRTDDRVQGMICEAALGAADIARLDRFEGAEYRRGAARALARDGGRRAVQVYRWRTRLPAGAEPIPGGDFLAWLASTGRSGFGVGGCALSARPVAGSASGKRSAPNRALS